MEESHSLYNSLGVIAGTWVEWQSVCEVNSFQNQALPVSCERIGLYRMKSESLEWTQFKFRLSCLHARRKWNHLPVWVLLFTQGRIWGRLHRHVNAMLCKLWCLACLQFYYFETLCIQSKLMLYWPLYYFYTNSVAIFFL